MKLYKKMTVLFFLFLTPFLCGCVNLKQPNYKINYYTLEYEPLLMAGYKTLPVFLKIERFSVAPTYDTDRIIYRDGSFKRNAYVYHKWSDNPGDLCAHFLYRDIRQSGLFKAVFPYNSEFQSSYKISGSVDEFFVWDTDEGWKAVLSLSFILMHEDRRHEAGKGHFFQKTYNITKPCEQKSPTALAKAMSQAMAEISLNVLKDVYDCLNQNPECD
ncbi:membrane integrity-associated transporter subunit PqiC [bacterium]|nr:membrane integrity-associated transporter subunit PqiC [bacterium]